LGLGRRVNSPPQLGQTNPSHMVQPWQKVHSKLQI
jgi:hypothetical protein